MEKDVKKKINKKNQGIRLIKPNNDNNQKSKLNFWYLDSLETTIAELKIQLENISKYEREQQQKIKNYEQGIKELWLKRCGHNITVKTGIRPTKTSEYMENRSPFRRTNL